MGRRITIQLEDSWMDLLERQARQRGQSAMDIAKHAVVTHLLDQLDYQAGKANQLASDATVNRAEVRRQVLGWVNKDTRND